MPTLVASALGLAKHVVDASGRGQIIWPLRALLGALFVAEAATGSVGRFLLERMGEGVVRQLRHGLVGRLLRLEMRKYGRHRGGDLISRVTTDTTLLREVVPQALVDLVTGSLVAAGTIVLMAWLDPPLLLLVAGTVATAALVVASLLTGNRCTSERIQDSVGEPDAPSGQRPHERRRRAGDRLTPCPRPPWSGQQTSPRPTVRPRGRVRSGVRCHAVEQANSDSSGRSSITMVARRRSEDQSG
ncbi:ABC transporter transmembrane domain-containing protein [Streptomyces sp. bgisy034]|uniref:ABC transporter transmembrane domain-containing protein n=1 Tax=Streptomyces sp. bgisy034 TaxID=3413774 RepID=UPI003EBC3E3A